MDKRAAALTNATAITARITRIQGQLPYATGSARKQLVTQLTKLRAARTNALNF